MELIRVLHVVGTMDLGGAETFIMNVYRNIDHNQVQFDFLCHNRIEAKFTKEIRDMGGRLYCVKGMSHVGYFGYQRQLRKFFKSHQEYKVVHAHQGELNGVILKQAKNAGVQVRISHAHFSIPNNKRLLKKLIPGILKLSIKNNINHSFACSQLAADYLYKGNLHKNCEVIHNAIDTAQMCFSGQDRLNIRKKYNCENKVVMGHIGRFATVKNHRFLIEIFDAYRKKEPNAVLMLIGAGALENEMKELVKEKNIDDKVFFLGLQTEISALLSAMDLFIMPSLHEGLPVVGVEAQSTGLSMLISDTVSNELKMTDLVHALSLSDTAERWSAKAKEIINDNQNKDRHLYSEIVKEQGYDICATAQSLQEFYMIETKKLLS